MRIAAAIYRTALRGRRSGLPLRDENRRGYLQDSLDEEQLLAAAAGVLTVAVGARQSGRLGETSWRPTWRASTARSRGLAVGMTAGPTAYGLPRANRRPADAERDGHQ